MKVLITILFAAIPLLAGEVAITIDDLVRGGDSGCAPGPLLAMTGKLLEPFRAGHLPLTGFVIGSRCPEVQAAALRLWVEAGATLGNHTWSHTDLNDTPVNDYITDVIRGEEPVIRATGVRPRYFRYPFLHAGADAQSRQAVIDFLNSHGYRNAPVTLDNSDYMFAAVYADALNRKDTALAAKVAESYLAYMDSIFAFFERRGKVVAGHEIRQILLIHASQLNADSMPGLLAMMSRRGDRVVSLDRALEDEAYGLPERYAGPGGFSWIHRWSIAKGLKGEAEQDEPKWITEAWNTLRRSRP